MPKRHRMTIVLFALFGAVLSGCQVETTTESDTNVTITKPGAVAVDAQVRRLEVANADLPFVCAAHSGVGHPGILNDVKGPRGYGLDERYNEISAHFRRLGADCLSGNDAACADTQQYALNWAQDSKLGGPTRGGAGARYWNDTLSINMRLLGPMLAALGVAEQFSPLAASDRDILDRWLKRKVDEYEHGMRHEGYYKGGRDGTTARKAAHNHAVQSSIAAMSYGAWANDERYFRTGIDQWYITLNSMRKDGSLPIETRRGARALFYQGRTLSGLHQLAERAAVQGIDLYNAAPSPSKTIHHAVAFFLDALEQPELVLEYAQVNNNPGPSKNYKEQDLGSMGSTFGWIAPYMRRFPDHENTHRMLERRTTRYPEPESYLTPYLNAAVRAHGYSSEWIGVDAGCFYADLELL